MLRTEPARSPYWKREKDIALQIKELRGRRRFLAGPSRNAKLLVDVTIRPDLWGDGDVEYYRREAWTEDGDDEIRGAGYVRCTGLVGGIVWRRIGVYIRIHNDRVFDVEAHEGELDDEGYPRYSLDTASTLGDYLATNAETKFIDALGRASMSAGTLTKIVALGVVAIAAVVLASVMGVLRVQLKQTKDVAIEELCTEKGDLLQVLSNLTAREQVTMIHTCLVGRRLGSRYMQSVGDMLLRATVGWHGRGRDDIVAIAKSDKGEGVFQEDRGESQRR